MHPNSEGFFLETALLNSCLKPVYMDYLEPRTRTIWQTKRSLSSIKLKLIKYSVGSLNVKVRKPISTISWNFMKPNFQLMKRSFELKIK